MVAEDTDAVPGVARWRDGAGRAVVVGVYGHHVETRCFGAQLRVCSCFSRYEHDGEGKLVCLFGGGCGLRW